MTSSRRLAPWVWVVVLAACGGAKEPSAVIRDHDPVRVTRVIKANEVEVEKEGRFARLRLVGTYAFNPAVAEKGDITTLGRQAVAFVKSALVDRKVVVQLIRPEVDAKGRYLVYLESDGKDFNRALVEQGLAAVYTEYPFDRERDYLAVEAEARAAQRGFWASTAAKKRLRALRDTWSAVQAREHGTPPGDPWLSENAATP